MANISPLSYISSMKQKVCPQGSVCNQLTYHNGADSSIAVIAVQFQLSEGGETTELVKGIVDKIGEVRPNIRAAGDLLLKK